MDALTDLPRPDMAPFRNVRTPKALQARENYLNRYFTEHRDAFTKYPDYFRTRTYEFRILRSLCPEYFRIGQYAKILEIGCGYGYNALLLAPFARRLIGTDIPEKYEGYIRGDFKTSTQIARAIVNGTFKQDQIEFEEAWPHDLTLPDGSVDMIFTGYVLEHIPDLPRAIREMHRVLKKGGVMIHVVPNTTDAILPFIEANVAHSKDKLIGLLKSHRIQWMRKTRGRARIRAPGIIVPHPHSEHVRDFMEQIQVYTLENYLYPMLDAGFELEKRTSTRETNQVIIVRKP